MYHYEKVPQASSRLMPINSCTKSILSALACIAMDRGQIPSPATRILDFFPQLRLDSDERKQEITIAQLLTLSAGFRWTEFGGRNSFPKMVQTDNWIEYVLAQPLSDEPGAKYEYNSGVSQLLAKIVTEATGMDLGRYAEQYLFGPLGIEHYVWKSDPQGVRTGGYGLLLTAKDLLKFGLLYLHEGKWQDQQIISQELVVRSTKPAVEATPPERGYYAWHWWCDSAPVLGPSAAPFDLTYYYARGFGGQFVFVVPSLQTVVVFTCRHRKKGFFPHDLFREQVAPMLVAASER